MQGPPISSGTVDGVSTLNPGEPATVAISFDGATMHFTFGIPRGAVGEQGIQGIAGLMGEVSYAALASEIATAVAGTSNNTNGVPTMDTPFDNDPPTLADMELMRANYNALVTALRR